MAACNALPPGFSFSAPIVSPVEANAGRKSRKLLIPAANHGCSGETRGPCFSTGLYGGYRADIKLSCDCNNRGLWPQRAPKEWRRETIFRTGAGHMKKFLLTASAAALALAASAGYAAARDQIQ
ncbi:hypothetical protein, partial [Mesorhizobium sp.]|uniref:hypothetical protein n=1 Tax=Mesorhizobium sp. TaxID=1871066 RepID=UPI0025CC5445